MEERKRAGLLQRLIFSAKKESRLRVYAEKDTGTAEDLITLGRRIMRYSLSLLALSSGLLLQCTHSNPSSLRSPSSPVIDKSGYAYNPADRSCDGYPRLNVGTMDGTCLGLAVPHEKAAWKMPRTIQQIPGTKDFLVVDMGGWAENRGALSDEEALTGL